MLLIGFVFLLCFQVLPEQAHSETCKQDNGNNGDNGECVQQDRFW